MDVCGMRWTVWSNIHFTFPVKRIGLITGKLNRLFCGLASSGRWNSRVVCDIKLKTGPGVQGGRSPVVARLLPASERRSRSLFPANLQHIPGSEIIKRLAEHARRLSRRWERGGNRRTRFGALIKTKTYHTNTASFVRPGMKIRLRFQ